MFPDLLQACASKGIVEAILSLFQAQVQLPLA
jgi:hypothetical protein